MEVRQAGASEWKALRRLRLQALADAPDAFASTLEAEAAFPTEVWRQRARGGPTSANFIARELEVDIGLATIFAEPNAPGRMHLVSMWVDPRHRRRGVARALVDQAVRWAAERQAHEVVLWVADQNSAARRLYERIGFRPTGERQPLPSNPARSESLLRLALEAVQPIAGRPSMPDYGISPDDEHGLLPWTWAVQRLERAHNYWVATCRPGGAPHLAAVWGIWTDGAFHFSTGPRSRKARNLASDARCVVSPEHAEESVVVEGVAERVTDHRQLSELLELYRRKYGSGFPDPGQNPVFAVHPRVVFGIVEDESAFSSSATRWVFPS